MDADGNVATAMFGASVWPAQVVVDVQNIDQVDAGSFSEVGNGARRLASAERKSVVQSSGHGEEVHTAHGEQLHTGVGTDVGHEDLATSTSYPLLYRGVYTQE